MDKTNKTYNWNEIKDLLPEHHPKESLWDSINASLDASIPEIDFNQLKDQLPEHEPKLEIWDQISKELERPEPIYDFNQLKGRLPSHEPESGLWDNISKNIDSPLPVFNFQDYKDQLSEHAPNENLWDQIESGLEISETIEYLPKHSPPENLWDQIEGELEEVKSGISIIKSAILIGLSMLFVIGAAIMLNQDDNVPSKLNNEFAPTDISPMQFASTEIIKIEWSDDEDVRLIQEMCQDYMAVCKQPEFKKLESELLELNDHKQELLEMVSDFDEESSYGPLLAKIENQKTALMKEMIAMI